MQKMNDELKSKLFRGEYIIQIAESEIRVENDYDLLITDVQCPGGGKFEDYDAFVLHRWFATRIEGVPEELYSIMDLHLVEKEGEQHWVIAMDDVLEDVGRMKTTIS